MCWGEVEVEKQFRSHLKYNKWQGINKPLQEGQKAVISSEEINGDSGRRKGWS